MDLTMGIGTLERACWWLADGKMCMMELVPLMYKNSYVCKKYHETTYEELQKRKTK